MAATEVLSSYSTAPSLANLTSAEYHRPRVKANLATESLGKPHVDSFNFMLQDGLRQVALLTIRQMTHIAVIVWFQ